LESGQAEILKKIENAADNNLSNSETLTESLFNDLADCPLSIDNIIDLNTLEDKISGDKCFRNKLVKFVIIHDDYKFKIIQFLNLFIKFFIRLMNYFVREKKI